MTASKDAVNARQLKILKMDTLHLNHYLNEMMLENPVIEIEENLTGYTDEDMRARKAEWLESNDFEEGLGYFDKETELPEAEDPDYALLNMHEGKTLEQHLRSQISVQQLDERVRAAANYLAGCLDENGYLLAQAQDLAEAGFCESEFDEALAVIRNLEPLGVGASSLKECLCLQLDEGDEIARRLLDEIDLTGSIDPAELAARFGVPAQEIEQAMLRIRRLNPKPGSQYTSHSRSPYILPDVTMIKFVDEYYVALNDYSLPRIRINEEYQNMLLRARGEEHREEREYLEEKIADAEKRGYGKLPVIIAKTQYSLSDDAKLLARPEGFTVHVRDVIVKGGAGFIVAVAGSIMLMPGLGKHPAAERIFVDERGEIEGLS